MPCSPLGCAGFRGKSRGKAGGCAIFSGVENESCVNPAGTWEEPSPSASPEGLSTNKPAQGWGTISELSPGGRCSSWPHISQPQMSPGALSSWPLCLLFPSHPLLALHFAFWFSRTTLFLGCSKKVKALSSLAVLRVIQGVLSPPLQKQGLG